MKKIIFLALVIFLASKIVLADEIILTNGNKFLGNIVEEDGDRVIIDIVIDNRLIGTLMTLSKEEIETVKKDEQYKNLVNKKLTVKEKKEQLELGRRNLLRTKNIDKIIKKRVAMEAAYNRDLEKRYDKKERLERKMAHEKEVMRLQEELQEELIKNSAKSGVIPEVKIINGGK